MSEKEKKEEKEKKPHPKQGGGGGGQKGEKKAKKPKGGEAEAAAVDDGTPQAPPPPARLYERFRKEIMPSLKEKLGAKNDLAVPRLEKIVISMGLGKFATEGGDGKARFQQAEKELWVIAGQKPLRCRAKKSVANFKVREKLETRSEEHTFELQSRV